MARGDHTAQVLKNKRIRQRTRSAVSASSLVPDLNRTDHYFYTSLGSGLTIGVPIGNPHDGDRLVFRIRDKGTSQVLSWNGVFRGAMPSSTTAGKTHFLEFRYNVAENKWDCVTVVTL
jgi:hypothetical protein